MQPASILLCSVALGSAAAAQSYVNTLVSTSAAGTQGTGASDRPAITPDGRYVVFDSLASNLVPSDANAKRDIFLKDLQTGAIELISVSTTGEQGDLDSTDPTVSADGRLVTFTSQATNLVLGDTNGKEDVFVRDRLLATTERISVATDGTEGTGISQDPFITPDGRYVTFSSESDLVPVWQPGVFNIFVRDLQTGTTTLESKDADLQSGQGGGLDPTLTPDGRYITFESGSNELVPDDNNFAVDVFVRDRLLGTVDRVSVDSAGQEQHDDSWAPSISDDGRFVVFYSYAFFSPDDNNFDRDIYVRDRQLGTTTLITPFASGGEFESPASLEPVISGDGRWVVFQSDSHTLVPGDTNGFRDVFVRDMLHGVTHRVTFGFTGMQVNEFCSFPAITPDARRIAITSKATNLVPGDTNGKQDIFVVDIGPWEDVGSALAGTAAPPLLVGYGTLQPATSGKLQLSGAAPSAPAILFVALTPTPAPVPFKGGTLVAFPFLLQVPVVTNPAGGLLLPFAWPAGIPVGTHMDFQYAVQDAGGLHGVTLSNALDALTP